MINNREENSCILNPNINNKKSINIVVDLSKD